MTIAAAAFQGNGRPPGGSAPLVFPAFNDRRRQSPDGEGHGPRGRDAADEVRSEGYPGNDGHGEGEGAERGDV